MTSLQLRLGSQLYVKDPQSTELGRRIVREAIIQIDKLGFETFTFRKLSQAIDSTEASIYRYFENKHRLLVYLITWYWSWLQYRIGYATNNIIDPRDKLRTALSIITCKHTCDDDFPDINEVALGRIVVAESEKTYLTKNVDTDNKEGLFLGYKALCADIANIVKEICPDYPYPHALISTVLEASNQQIFFSEHLPSLTEVDSHGDAYQTNCKFLTDLVFNTLTTPKIR